uniref:PGG domain-containing protein n=1 Tax=Aegilops tauschii subsp. strangulata TaxID=200361 RepID=A0A453RCI6_AEGTS
MTMVLTRCIWPFLLTSIIRLLLSSGDVVERPVANWLQKVKTSSLCCVEKLGRALSLSFSRHRPSNAEQENSYASNHHSSVRSTDTPAEDNTPEPQDQPADNQQLPNIREDESHEEHAPAEERNQISDDEEAVNHSQHLSGNSQQSTNIEVVASNAECPSTHVQCVANPECQSTDVEQNMPVRQSNGDTSHDIVDEGLSAPAEATGNADSAEQNNLVEDNNPSTEINQVPNQNADDIRTEKHLKKTRTCMLLLAILAVSLAYQSGLNPPASIVMITLLLNKMVSNKVTKRRALPITMIVVLLSLTGAFAVGNCREAKKTIFISALVCSVLAYVLIHVLIAVHIIPPEWRRQVAEMLEHSVSHFCSVPRQLGHTQTGGDTSEKELGRRRNLLLTIAILAVTVTYQAGMNPPGGVWSDDKDATGTPGNPILQDTHPKRYDVFYYSNSVSFVSSVVVTILLVNKESCEYGIKSYALRVCLVAGLLGLLIAYVAGSCRNIKQSIYLSIIAMAVLVSLLIQVLLSSICRRKRSEKETQVSDASCNFSSIDRIPSWSEPTWWILV